MGQKTNPIGNRLGIISSCVAGFDSTGGNVLFCEPACAGARCFTDDTESCLFLNEKNSENRYVEK